MLCLILAIISSTLVSVFMRLSEGKVKNTMTMFMSNYIICSLLSLIMGFGNLRTAFASILGLSNAAVSQSAASYPALLFAIILGFIGGAFYLLGFVLYRISIEKNGIVLSALFMKLGVLVPTLTAVLIYHEHFSFLAIIGFLLVLAAIILINTDGAGENSSPDGSEENSSPDATQKNEQNHGQNFGQNSGSVFLLIILLLSCGSSDALSNVYENNGLPLYKDLFLLCIFVTATLLCIILKVKNHQGATPADFFWGALLGIPNYFSARFLLLSLASLPAVLVYPVYNATVIILVTLAGVFAFKEMLSRKKCLALLLMLLALILLNL